MGENEKPFACTNEGCQMTFTNEDHLNIHQKKHDMVLNLNCKNNVFVADQTPTPTRFIRNCEEVGLFQDLQNVNPFEETFRKAAESARNGTLHVPDAVSDDTLHTPQIYPPIEETNTFKSNTTFSISRVPSLDENLLQIDDKVLNCNKDCDIIKHCDNIEDDVIITIDDNEKDDSSIVIQKTVTKTNSLLIRRSKNNEKLLQNSENKQLGPHTPILDIKTKIKNALKNRQKSTEESPDIILDNQTSVSPQINLTAVHKDHLNISASLSITSRKRNAESDSTSNPLLEKKRAINRAAQSRSRQRKKCWLNNMETQMSKLKVNNKLLASENENLKKEVEILKTILLYHHDCNASQDLSISNKVQELLNSLKKPDRLAITSSINNTTSTASSSTKFVPIVPQTNVNNVIAVIPTVIANIPQIPATTTISNIPNMMPVIQNVSMPNVTLLPANSSAPMSVSQVALISATSMNRNALLQPINLSRQALPTINRSSKLNCRTEEKRTSKGEKL